MTTIAQPTVQQVVRALRRNGVDMQRPLGYELLGNGWLRVQLDAGGGIELPPKDIYPSGPDCFGLLAPHAECVGRTSCPRPRACNE